MLPYINFLFKTTFCQKIIRFATHSGYMILRCVLHCTVLYCTVLYCTVLYSTVLYCTVLHCILLYCKVLYSTVLYCTVLYCTVLYCTVLYCTVKYCTVLHCTVLYCTVLYCTTFDFSSTGFFFLFRIPLSKWMFAGTSVLFFCPLWVEVLRWADPRSPTGCLYD